jgi:formylglycine-generating enzyme required for sulfatase activity
MIVKCYCKWCIILLSILYLGIGCVQGQTAEVVHVQAIGDTFEIRFDVLTNRVSRIELFYSVRQGESWQGPLQGVEVASGNRVHSGKHQSLIWPIGRDTFLRERVDVQFYIKLIPVDGFEPDVVFVQGGTFMMGCFRAQKLMCDTNELPLQRVSLGNYYMGKYEVTRSQWYALMEPESLAEEVCPDCPIEIVSFEDIQVYLDRLRGRTGKPYRLPTEAEWEFAARGGNHDEPYAYSGGDSLEAVGWYVGNARQRYTGNENNRVQPVGMKKPNALGLYDMSGNVWEWCSDIYGKYRRGMHINPKGSEKGSFLVNRGGGWADVSDNCRVSYRGGNNPSYRDDDVGFRVVLEVD